MGSDDPCDMSAMPFAVVGKVTAIFTDDGVFSTDHLEITVRPNTRVNNAYGYSLARVKRRSAIKVPKAISKSEIDGNKLDGAAGLQHHVSLERIPEPALAIDIKPFHLLTRPAQGQGSDALAIGRGAGAQAVCKVGERHHFRAGHWLPISFRDNRQRDLKIRRRGFRRRRRHRTRSARGIIINHGDNSQPGLLDLETGNSFGRHLNEFRAVLVDGIENFELGL